MKLVLVILRYKNLWNGQVKKVGGGVPPFPHRFTALFAIKKVE